MPKKIDLIYHGKSEVLNIVDTGGSIVSYLGVQDYQCPLIGSEIVLEKKLGKGTYGVVYSLNIKGRGKKQYVAKKLLANYENGKVPQRSSLKAIYKNLKEYHPLLSKEVFISLNGGDENRMIKQGGTIIIPIFASICKLKDPYVYKRFYDKKVMTVKKGNYVCENETYSEYYIGMLCADLYRKGVSANFIDLG